MEHIRTDYTREDPMCDHEIIEAIKESLQELDEVLSFQRLSQVELMLSQ